MPTQYLFVFAQAHDDFRIPELLSISELHNFTITLPDDPEECDPSRPYMILGLVEEEHARILARRCILVR
jgi:tRNA (guanine10-N2)-methyltransferase